MELPEASTRLPRLNLRERNTDEPQPLDVLGV
jgi:hypothetical protein